MGYWTKHPRPELESLLGEYHEAGWSITRGRKYYKARCPCGDHQRTIHISPSDPNYGKNSLKWLYRQPCYRGSVSR